jgi:hypothetical protein
MLFPRFFNAGDVTVATSVAVGYQITTLEGGRNAPESVAGFLRNRWPGFSGIGGRNRAEYSFDDHKVKLVIYVPKFFIRLMSPSALDTGPEHKSSQ